MTSINEDIDRWIEDAPEGTSHMIVSCDTFSNDYCPIYIPEGTNPRNKKEGSMEKFMECYCLREDFEMTIEEQKNERRANHWR